MLGVLLGLLLGLLAAGVAAAVAAFLHTPEQVTSWVCTGCLQGFSRYDDALRHVAAVHRRT